MVPGSKTEVARRLKQRRNKSQHKCVLLGICYEQLLTAIGSGLSGQPEKPTEHQKIIQVSVERRLEQSSFCSLTHCVALRQWPVRLCGISVPWVESRRIFKYALQAGLCQNKVSYTNPSLPSQLQSEECLRDVTRGTRALTTISFIFAVGRLKWWAIRGVFSGETY